MGIDWPIPIPDDAGAGAGMDEDVAGAGGRKNGLVQTRRGEEGGS